MFFEGLPLYQYAFVFAGCALVLLFASKIVYSQLLVVAKKLSLPPFFVASLLVAFSTSIPELFIGIDSAVHQVPSFALGNILGSNILGLSLITGVIMLFTRKPIDLRRHIDERRLLVSFILASVPAFMLIDGVVSSIDGAILLALYAFYIGFSIYTRQGSHERHPTHSPKSLVWSVGIFGIGALLLVAASQVLFTSALSISKTLDIAPLMIGIFALSFSTTFPEWSFGFRSAINGKPEFLLADIVGANVVNACGTLGLAALICPIVPVDPGAALLSAFFGVGLYVVFYSMFAKKVVAPSRGAFLVFLYVCFVVMNLNFA